MAAAGLAANHRSFVPQNLQPALPSSRLTATVLVQSLPALADIGYLLDLAGLRRLHLGVFAWADLKRAGAAAAAFWLCWRPNV